MIAKVCSLSSIITLESWLKLTSFWKYFYGYSECECESRFGVTGTSANGNESKKNEKRKISISCLTKATQKRDPPAAAGESLTNNTVSKDAMSLTLDTKSRKFHKADIEKWNAISKHTFENEEGKTQTTKIRRTIHGKPMIKTKV